MEKLSLQWKNSPPKQNPTPISKIRTLINHLDKEIGELRSQYTLPKRKTSTSKTNRLLSPVESTTKRTPLQNLDQEIAGLHSQCILDRPKVSPTTNKPRSLTSIGSKTKTSTTKKCWLSPVTTKKDLINSQYNNPTNLLVKPNHLSNVYKARVIDAYRHRRIFTIHGRYQTLRRALLRRGWLEKFVPGRSDLTSLSDEILLQNAKHGNNYEAALISKIINNFPPFFIWQPKAYRDLYADVLPYRNRIRRRQRMDFSNKVGLIGCAEQEHWFQHNGICGMRYPRFYRLRSPDERKEFTEEYRRTQCRNFIRFIIEKSAEPSEILDEEYGTILPSSVLHYAMACIKHQLNDWEHKTLDDDFPQRDFDQIEWKQFLITSNSIIRGHLKLKFTLDELNEFVRIAKGYLDKIEERCPEYKWDGVRNLWILKPGFRSRGIGIIIRSSVDEILQYAINNEHRRYIVQKYIERPLLIHKCKFDIRQYMLVTFGEKTVSIWLYKDCYLRFSSQEFTIDDLRESIHLTNNSVQKRYKVKTTRDLRLPKNNMWSLEQFKVFLKHQNVPEDTWTNKVYAGFKESLIAVVLASFEETDFIENAFELYGCDFMLDEQYNPILIEINSTPDLSPSTDVTARICPLALKDLVKVVVDLPRNSRASTGLFEMVYEVNYKTKQDFDPQVGLNVDGKAIKLHVQKHYLRNPFCKKLMPKRAETSHKISLHKNKKDNKLQTKAKSYESVVPAKNSTAINTKQKTLKSFAKEALALRYTRPK